MTTSRLPPVSMEGFELDGEELCERFKKYTWILRNFGWAASRLECKLSPS